MVAVHSQIGPLDERQLPGNGERAGEKHPQDEELDEDEALRRSRPRLVFSVRVRWNSSTGWMRESRKAG